MKKLLGAIFGSSENTKTVVDGAVNGIDAMFHTDEEKTEARQRMADWYLKYLAATQPQNLARRLIALVIVALWALLIVAGVAAWPWLPGFSDFVFNVLGDLVMPPFLTVMGFYFAAHVIRAYREEKG